MNYSQDEFFDLMRQVEEQGGEHIDRQCKATTYYFTGDKKHKKPLTFPMCGNRSIFKVPFLQPEGGMLIPEDELPTLEVCAVDDELGRWPRFGGDRFASEERDDEDPYPNPDDPEDFN